ncbi:hypothetical protein SAMN05660662_1515 [Blastococcus aurantiacus]|uniref:Ig-like domain-containing protein n=1 Tax=Blastococcus aurantiacus TaxID=1550231 RepID=A0A1G7JHJ2_9ACTN|nr:hypothetical protein SAMN05660662_1515 [Blastococcus aurantiacus]
MAGGVLGLVLGSGVGPAAAAPGDQTVTDCTEAALRQALADVPDGGTVAIACDDPIVVTPEGGSTIIVDKSVTISGAGHDVVIDGAQRTSLFAVQAGSEVSSPDDLPTLTLRDLTLRAGWSQDAGYPGGGAVWNLANLVAERVRFVDNRAFNRGGAILSQGFGRLTVVDSEFAGNRVTCPNDGSGGGAIAVRQRQQTTITGTVFTDNTATGLASGGAVLAYVSSLYSGLATQPPPEPLPPSPFGAPLVITGSTFTGNGVTLDWRAGVDRMYGGGAVASFDHELSISDTRFEGNEVGTPGTGYGGAILAASIREAATSLTGVDVLDNGFPDRFNGLAANGFGGGVVLQGTPATVADSVVEGNRALVGGGLFTRGGPVEVVDSVVEANVAGAVAPGNGTYGGGLATYGPLTLTRASVVGNSGGSCRILWGDGPIPLGDVVVDGGGNEVDGPATCFRPLPPAAAPSPTGALTAPTAPVTPGSGTAVSGTGLAPGARVTLVGYLLSAPAPAVATASMAAAAAPAPVDLGSVQADDTGAFAAMPVLTAGGVWRLVALGAAPDGTTSALTAVVVVAAPGTDVAPVVTTDPAPVTAATGSAATLTAAAAGAPAPTVQWQTSRDGGGTWTDVPGATGSSLTTTARTGTTLFRAVFTNTAGSATSAAAAVTGTGSPGGGPDPAPPVPPDGAEEPADPSTPADPSAPADGSPDPELARTGTEVLPMLAAGAAVLLLGCVVLLAVRRRTAG